MLKELLLTGILLLAFICNGFAQKVTNFSPSNNPRKITLSEASGTLRGSKTYCATIDLSKVEIWDNYVDVTYIIRALMDMPKGLYLGIAWNAKLTDKEGGYNFGLQVEGIVSNGTVYMAGLTQKRGWGSLKKDEYRYMTIRFKGKMPEGVTSFEIKPGDELITTASPFYYSRTYYFCYEVSDLNNPRVYYEKNLTSESLIKQHIDKNNDGICGIYEKIGGGYRLACIKQNGEYKLLYMGGSSASYWKIGDIKAWLTKTPSGIFKAKWRMSDKSVNNDFYITFDGYSMTVSSPSRKEEDKYLKTYPANSPAIGAQGGGGNNSNGSEWTGTGFALKNGYIVTNHHVVEGAKSIVVLGVNGNTSTEYKAKVVGVDKNNDLALIKIDDYRFAGFKNIPYAIPNTIREVGSDVFVLGYPLTTYMGEEIKLTNGIISSRTGYQGDVSTYQISAPVQPGNSGGPLFDNKGNVIGIVNAGIPGAENVGYAVKTSYLYNLVQSVANTSIIPQTNTITGTSLADKVKQVKSCVFFIKCKGN